MKINDVFHTKFKNRTFSIGNNHVYDYSPAKPKTVKSIMNDKEGLKRAYQNGHYFIHGDTMYIAGSHTGRDWYDDFTKIPIWGDLRESERYQKAKGALLENPQVKKVVGHSLGGSVALELQKDYKHITGSRTYGAPVWDPLGKQSNNVDRYRNIFDPVSSLDGSAKTYIKGNPFNSWSLTHDYSNIAEKFKSKANIPESTTNPDGSTTLYG